MLGLSVPAWAEQFFAGKVGDRYEYIRSDASHNQWTSLLEIDRGMTKKSFDYLHIQTWNYDNDGKWVDEGYVRSTENELYGYNARGEDYLAFQKAPIGTKWSYYEKHDEFNYKVREVVEIGPVTVPYGSFDEAYKYRSFLCNDPNNPGPDKSPDYYAWWVPGVGMVKEEDYWNKEPPMIMELKSVSNVADLLVYNLKSLNTKIEFISGGWSSGKIFDTYYLVVEPNGGKLTDRIIGIWKGKGGKKYYEDDGTLGTSELLQVQIGKKQMWIMTGDDGKGRILLTGEAKPTKVGDVKPVIAAKLVGIAVVDIVEGSDRHIGTRKMSVSINPKVTSYLQGFKGEDAISKLFDYLKSQGYEED
jgi:hypothetical protein